MLVCLYDFYLESHRRLWMGDRLVRELKKVGVDCCKGFDPDIDFAFCGAFEKIADFRREYADHNCKAPIVHYNWDLYPFQLDKKNLKNENIQVRTACGWFYEYIDDMKSSSCVDIWVPSNPVVKRITEYVGRASKIVKASIQPFEGDFEVTRGDYVVNPMRVYQDEPNVSVVRECCEELGIKYIDRCNGMSWQDFQKVIAGARFLVSPYYEASTGSLSLLEAHWIGKPVLIADSPYQGGRDYFGDRAQYFRWNDREHLKQMLKSMYNDTPYHDIEDCQGWITENYSDAALAKRMAEGFKCLM